jgi:ELWxxDGT repeat protein
MNFVLNYINMLQGIMSVSELEQEDFAGIICLDLEGDASSSSSSSGSGSVFSSTGQELWRSDGSYEGTYRLDDVYEGSAGSFPKVM